MYRGVHRDSHFWPLGCRCMHSVIEALLDCVLPQRAWLRVEQHSRWQTIQRARIGRGGDTPARCLEKAGSGWLLIGSPARFPLTAIADSPAKRGLRGRSCRHRGLMVVAGKNNSGFTQARSVRPQVLECRHIAHSGTCLHCPSG